MSIFRSSILLVLPLLLSGPEPTHESAVQIDRVIQRTMKQHHLPALAITIVEDQNILYQQALGCIDLEKNIPASSSSVFKLLSVSKVFTAIEIFKETEEGLVDLDRPLLDYLPNFKIQNGCGEMNDITIRTILAHRSGLPRNECLRVPAGEEDTGTLDRFEIGTWDCYMPFPTAYRYKYSNLGYDLLGRVIEENRSKAYSEYMRSLLRSSLGMKHSTFDDRDISDSEQRVKGYEYHKGKFHPRIQTNINSVPSGNLYASSDDLVNFFKTLFQNKVFQDETTLSLMFEDHYSRPEDPETMGLGWKTTRLSNEELLAWHDGGPSEGIGSVIALLPDRKLGIAMMANSSEFSGAISIQLAIKILDEILTNESGSMDAPLKSRKKVTVSKQSLEEYEGRYLAFGKKMDVKRRNRKLKGKIGMLGFNLIPSSETEFRVTNWMDKIGLTKLFRAPVDFDKIKVSFGADSLLQTKQMIINLNHLAYEICPSYPEQIHLPNPMEDLPGTYRLAWRLPYNEPGPFSGDLFSISLVKEVLSISGVFGPILPRNNHQMTILCGPFAGEIMEYDAKTGQILHQNTVFLPSQ